MGFLNEIQTIGKMLQKAGNIELYEKLLAYYENSIKIAEENNNLREKIKKLEKELEIKGQLRFENDIYWLEEEGEKEGPFCPRCYDGKKTLMHLVQAGSPDFYKCPDRECGFIVKKY